MLRKALALFFLAATLWLSGCATGSRPTPSYDYQPSYPFTYQDLCEKGAVYCGPNP